MSELIEASMAGKDAELSHFLIASFCRLPKGQHPGGRGDGHMEVTLTVNGVETSFRDAATRWFEAYDDTVRREAAKMVKDKLSLGEIIGKINALEYEIDAFIEREFGARP